jgi:tetratricopeptide (TPR) repeat protein
MGLGQIEEALTRFSEAIDTARSHTVPRAQGIAALNQARALWQQGDRKTAIKAAATAADVLASIGSSESAAADALQEAVATAGEPTSRQHLEALLVCARAIAGNGDLFPPYDLATAVRDGAERAGIVDLRAQAEAILKDLDPV